MRPIPASNVLRRRSANDAPAFFATVRTLTAVSAHAFPGALAVVETYVYYLRRKLGQELIRTVRNFGYLIAA